MIDDVSTETLPPPAESLLLTVEETAERLNVSRSTVYALMRSGDLRGITIRTNRRFARADVDAYVARLLDAASAKS
jgi:excisionase family DNA binding protein